MKNPRIRIRLSHETIQALNVLRIESGYRSWEDFYAAVIAGWKLRFQAPPPKLNSEETERLYVHISALNQLVRDLAVETNALLQEIREQVDLSGSFQESIECLRLENEALRELVTKFNSLLLIAFNVDAETFEKIHAQQSSKHQAASQDPIARMRRRIE
jgi:hypothetical protein